MDSSDSKAFELTLTYQSDPETLNQVTSQPNTTVSNTTVSNSSSPTDNLDVELNQPIIKQDEPIVKQPIVTHTLNPNDIFNFGPRPDDSSIVTYEPILKGVESEPIYESTLTNSINSKDSKNSSASGKDSKSKGMACFMKEELSANSE